MNKLTLDLDELQAKITPKLQEYMRGKNMNSQGFLEGRLFIKKEIRQEFKTDAEYKAFLKTIDIVLKEPPAHLDFDPGTFVFGLRED